MSDMGFSISIWMLRVIAVKVLQKQNPNEPAPIGMQLLERVAELTGILKSTVIAQPKAKRKFWSSSYDCCIGWVH